MSGRKEFSQDDKMKKLLWCDRHCTLCGKTCNVDIEIHHIDDSTNNDLDNGMPLCYDCHAKLHHYNDRYPMGTKFKPPELKIRRDQIYEKHTRPLIPPIDFQIPLIDKARKRAAVTVTNLSDQLQCQMRVNISAHVGKENKGLVRSRYYNGKRLWNLPPRRRVTGNFPVKDDWHSQKDERLRFGVNITIIDIYEREHPQLPFAFTNVKNEERCYFEPASIDEIINSL